MEKRFCLLCGKEFKPYSHDSNKRKSYCTRECYLKAMEIERNTPKSYCKTCGKPIYEWSKRKKGIPKVFCSSECNSHRPSQRFKYTTCQFCGKTFKEARDSLNLYCSIKCSGLASKALMILNNQDMIEMENDFKENERRNKEHKEELLANYKALMEQAEKIRYRIEHEKVCICCGKEFTAKSTAQKCCSEECSKKHTNRNKDKRIYKNGKPDNSITLTKLYMRDGAVCKICGRKIDFDCEPNSNYYPSIDHIKPIAKGGLHIWDNVQLACRICNSVKSDKYDGTCPPVGYVWGYGSTVEKD